MKSKFTSFDVACVAQELQRKIEGLRVINVYDINNKSYIIKLGQDVKTMLYIESGCRINTTAFEWPKQMMPSAFSSKCRKVMRNKRLTSIKQIGCDRVIDLQFGSEEFSSHLIVELYDKGNVCLCDHQYIITAVLRTRQDAKEDVKYAVGHFYPLELCQNIVQPNIETLQSNLQELKPNTQLKRWLNFQYPFSIPLIEHCLRENGLNPDLKLTIDIGIQDIEIISRSMDQACELYKNIPLSTLKGIIFYKNVKSSTTEKVMDEFHPHLFSQLKEVESKEFTSYNEAIDNYFYEQGTQKIEIKSIAQEKGVLKKLDNIKKDHETRIKSLQETQEQSKYKAYLIEVNLTSVDEAIDIIQNAIANRLSWDEIDELVQEGQENGHAIALIIKRVSLDRNEMTLSLTDPYDEESGEDNVDVDLDMGAYGNAKRYFDEVKLSAAKELKTIQSSTIALKNAEKKTQATLKDINVVTSIKKARKTMWFEKFLWFFSSEKYIVIGGRDAQQNEILVKRYLKKNDVYVHADVHGATSIIIKNKSNEPIPPKTLVETGTFALCHSAAWNNKIVISAYWVHAHQVSKTAPSGEYLTTGSFMIRGKKNYLPPSQHILGFSVLFKIDDESIEKRRNVCKLNLRMQEDEDTPVKEEVKEEVLVEEIPVKEVDNEDTNSKSEDEIQDADEVVDDLFDKYNLQISAIPKQESTTSNSTEFTEFIGAAHKPHYKHKTPTNDNTGPGKNNQTADTAPKKQNNTQKRGQKAKQKKLQKYADQSDDEREAKMALLGSAGTKKKKEKSKTSNTKLKYRAQSNAKNVVSEFQSVQDVKEKLNEVQRVELTLEKLELDKMKKEESEEESKDTEETNTVQDTVSTPAEPPQETAKNVQKVTDTNKPSVQPEDETSDTEDEPIDFLDSLILYPNESDTILFGIPFVAPYSVMSMCKYKCKLTPGATKKGKACKTILDLFGREKEALVQEKNVFKSLKDVDMTVNIPGKVKISAPNLHGNKRR